MAIDINRHQKEGKTTLTINMSNGHLEALEKIKGDYGFPSEREALMFMLGVISQAGGSPVEVNGSKYVPSDALKKSSKD